MIIQVYGTSDSLLQYWVTQYLYVMEHYVVQVWILSIIVSPSTKNLQISRVWTVVQLQTVLVIPIFIVMQYIFSVQLCPSNAVVLTAV